MRKIIFSIATLSIFVSTTFAHVSLIKSDNNKKGQQQQPTFELKKVAGNVHVLFGVGGNMGVSHGSDGLLTIDTQFARYMPQIKAELRKLGSDKPKYVFNTHHHGDHMGGNALFGQDDALIIAHNNVRTRLLNAVRRGQSNPTPKIALPTITYSSGLSIHFNDEVIKAVHFKKGHTDGDTVIFFTGSNVVHLGDDFFAGHFPFVDLRSGGSVAGLIKNIGKIIKMIPEDAKLIPGHGAISTLDDLKEYYAMLVETTSIVRKHMKDGKTFDQIKAAGLPSKYTNWASDFITQERWIKTIYDSYSISMKKKT